MTPEQKLKWAILLRARELAGMPPENVTAENVDELYDSLVNADGHWDAQEEVRNSGEKVDVPCTEYSRHYECDSVAAQMPDGSWVGWTYWYGGGKHSEQVQLIGWTRRMI